VSSELVVVGMLNNQVNPVILVPGTTGSQIEAKLSRTSVPRWWCNAKRDWFRLWIDTSQLLPELVECWVDNFKLVYNQADDSLTNTPGVSTRIPGFGSTYSIEYIQPGASFTAYFNVLVDFLVNSAGYQRNVSVRGAPYDFRYAPNTNKFWLDSFKRLIEETFEMNNQKRVSLVTHSMGGLYTLYFLNQQDQAWKEKYVKSFIPISAPWGGSVKSCKTLATGDPDPLPWLNSSLVRIEQSSSESNFWLLPTEQIFPQNQPIIITDHRNYTATDWFDFFNDADLPNGKKLYQRVSGLTSELVFPNVSIQCLYSTGIETPEAYLYSGNKRSGFDNEPLIKNGDGDGSVNLISLKGCKRWLDDHSDQVQVFEFGAYTHTNILNANEVFQTLMRIINN